MPVFLSFGKDENQKLTHISSQMSGRSDLICPFCGMRLIAVKGGKVSHHFRHDGITCSESLNEFPSIDGWHQFHLNFPTEVIESLKSGYKPNSKAPNVFHDSENSLSNRYQEQLLRYNGWGNVYEFTDTANVILGNLSLVKFSNWMRNRLEQRVSQLREDVRNGRVHKGHLEIEGFRQQSILTSTLYLFEYQLSDKKLFKVGRTNRDVSERLKETIRDVEKSLGCKVAKSSILRTVQHGGFIERYVFHRYQANNVMVGSHTEYFDFDNKALRNLKTELTKLANNFDPFNKNERFITTGRYAYEEKRLAASKVGIASRNRQGKFGRPKGTKLTDQKLIDKYPLAVTNLSNGCTVDSCASATGIGRSTVVRVKKAMRNLGMFGNEKAV